MTKDELIISTLEHLTEAINQQGQDIMHLQGFLSRTLSGFPSVGGGHLGNTYQAKIKINELKMMFTQNQDHLTRLSKEEI